MAIKGYRDLSSAVNVGVDDSVLSRYQLADGVTYDQLVAELRVVVAGLNGEMARHPLWSSLVSFQQEPNVAQYAGSSTYADALTEYSRPEPQHAEMSGHMLPIRPYVAMLGWTWLKLKDMSFAEGQNDIRLAVDRLRNTYRRAIVARLLQRGDDSGAAKGLGAGYSPGFATASGSTNLPFTPPSANGNIFTSSHEHYNATAGSGAWTTAQLDAIEADLREHGHMPPYRVLVSNADAATIAGLTGFVPPAAVTAQPGSGTAIAIPEEAATGDGYVFLGSYKNSRIYVVPGIPTYYGFGYRSYGALSPLNPIRIRTEKGYGQPTARVLRQVTSGVTDAERGIDPLQDLGLFLEFGVGVGDRTNGVANYNNNATWADGVAS